MKRFFVASVLMLAISANFSFTTPARGDMASHKPFKKYVITVLNVQNIPGSQCQAVTMFSFSFDWNGNPNSQPTNFQLVGVPSFTIQCPDQLEEVRQSQLTGYQFTSGHFTSASFASTGHATIDGRIADPTFIQGILDDINDQIDAQQ